MYNVKREILQNGRGQKFFLFHEKEPMRYATALKHWQSKKAFRSFFISLLKQAPFSAYRWETPPATLDTRDQAFEFVIVDDPALARLPDQRPFARHFTDDDAGIVVFENIGKDAVLVVASPRGPDSTYGHLAVFTREASESQNHALWQTVGKTMEDRICRQPIWLSTAGAGVSWLHVRLDSRPKYYAYRPYAESA